MPNPDASAQESGRRHIVAILKRPWSRVNTLDLMVGGRKYDWSFSIEH